MPPVIGGEPEELPRGTPWFPQAMCNANEIFCSAGQEPDNDRGDNSSTSGKSLAELVNMCYAIYDVEVDVCRANRGAFRDYRSFLVCEEKARNRREACRSTARDLTDNGAHAAP